MKRLGCVCFLLFAVCAFAETEVRIATYNIKYLKANVKTERRKKIKKVIELLDADIIALQEIDDRKALEAVFDKNEWLLIIDEESGNNQDVALAVLKARFKLPDGPADQDADNEHFLFPGAANNTFFPNRRDVLCVRVKAKDEDVSFFVMVLHTKSRHERVGGRATNEHRRVGAARALVDKIRADFDDKPFIMLGDMNDNPDDASLNILETGVKTAAGGREDIAGTFLLNLTEPLCAQGHVSHGLKSDAVVGDRLNTIDPSSRDRNNNYRGTNANTGDILFDQILIPAWMADAYVADSCKVFDIAVAAKGNSSNRASDHVPVFADFVFNPDGDVPAPATLRIISLLPNPAGVDENNEQVTLQNGTADAVDLAGWKLVDKAGNSFSFSGQIASGATKTFTMQAKPFLNNMGDTVWLEIDGQKSSEVTYTAADARSGATAVFP